MVTKDKRFKDLKSEGPGPGSYEVNTVEAHILVGSKFRCFQTKRNFVTFNFITL